MALIPCPDCGTQVSDAAPACPKCSRPMKATTIEATGKQWKLAQMVAVMFTIVGCVTFIGQSGEPSGGTSGFAMFFIGFMGFIAARVGAWWHHG